jgi:hypothetical protein
MAQDFCVLEVMCKQLKAVQQDAGLIYLAAYDPEAWFMVGDHTIYWPAHLMHDRPSLFNHRGLVKFTLRSNTTLTITPSTSSLQIILCGLLLVLQLVSGEHFTSDLLTDYHRCNDEFDFASICA